MMTIVEAFEAHGIKEKPRLKFLRRETIGGLSQYTFEVVSLPGRTYSIPVEAFQKTHPRKHARQEFVRVGDMQPGDVIYPLTALQPRMRVIERISTPAIGSRRIMHYRFLGDPQHRDTVASKGTRWVLHKRATR